MGKDGARADCVKVVVRCRPLNSQEKKKGMTNVVQMDPRRGTVNVINPAQPSTVPKEYTFDKCFDWNSKQLDIYNATARGIVDSVLEGYNGTIFAYGQTGTGKTFTMEGERDKPELCGIIPNSFAHIFGHLSRAEGDTNWMVRVSYMEIYCEDVRDLLGDGQRKLEVRERPDVGVYVKDLSSFVVKNADDMDKIMTKGNKNRMTGSTKMNARSSRSHAIFSVLIERSDKGLTGKDAVRMGKLHLVDLAGSERQSKTGAEGQRLKEATKINLSLTTLGNVISALVMGKNKHVPYRDSKLTRLLQDSLGGNAKTVMIANFGPANYNYDETMSTLRYADRAKQIKNKPKINENPKDALLREYQEELERLRKQLEGEGGSSGEEGETDSSSSEEEVIGWDGTKTRRKKEKKRGKKGKHRKAQITEAVLASLAAEIDREKMVLKEQTDLAAEEKDKLKRHLEAKEKRLHAAQGEREALQRKMNEMQSKVIVGGVNLLQKAEEQDHMLEEARKELERREAQHVELEREIESKDAEVIDIEEKYKSLEEEVAGKTKKLKKVWTMLQQAKAEVEDINMERQRQNEAMIENIRQLSRELRLCMLVIDNYIPPEYQDQIEGRAQWNEAIGEYQIPGVAYTGNSMAKVGFNPPDSPEPDGLGDLDKNDKIYLSYSSMVDNDRPAKAPRSKSSRPKTGRPKTSKKKRQPQEDTAEYPSSNRPSTAARYR